jgi:hypothetical protein
MGSDRYTVARRSERSEEYQKGGVYLTVELRVVEPYRTCGTRGTVQLGSISDSDIGIGSAGIEGPR